jgi:hypothetical protein
LQQVTTDRRTTIQQEKSVSAKNPNSAVHMNSLLGKSVGRHSNYKAQSFNRFGGTYRMDKTIILPATDPSKSLDANDEQPSAPAEISRITLMRNPVAALNAEVSAKRKRMKKNMTFVEVRSLNR